MPQPHSTSSPLMRFCGERNHNGKPLLWGRAAQDNMPILGMPRGQYGEEEFARKMVPTKYFKFKLFDLKVENDRKEYCDVLDHCLNGWWQMMVKERILNPQDPTDIKWYLEWYQVYLEDGSMADAMVEAAQQ